MSAIFGALVAGLTIGILELSGVDISLTAAVLIGLLVGVGLAAIGSEL